jgi:hypothetical protein
MRQWYKWLPISKTFVNNERGLWGMKTVSVRIEGGQFAELGEIAKSFPGASVNGLVQRAVELWLEVEGPVYQSVFKEAKAKLNRK